MSDSYIWGLGAIGILIVLVYSLAIFGKVEKPHKATRRN